MGKEVIEKVAKGDLRVNGHESFENIEIPPEIRAFSNPPPLENESAGANLTVEQGQKELVIDTKREGTSFLGCYVSHIVLKPKQEEPIKPVGGVVVMNESALKVKFERVESYYYIRVGNRAFDVAMGKYVEG